MPPWPDTMPATGGTNFDYTAFGAAVAAALAPVQRVRVEPMHVVRDQLLSVPTAQALCLYPVTNQQSIVVRAGRSNTGTVYIGPDSTVGAASSWPLGAGESLQLDTDAELWVLASASGQSLHVIAGG